MSCFGGKPTLPQNAVKQEFFPSIRRGFVLFALGDRPHKFRNNSGSSPKGPIRRHASSPVKTLSPGSFSSQKAPPRDLCPWFVCKVPGRVACPTPDSRRSPSAAHTPVGQIHAVPERAVFSPQSIFSSVDTEGLSVLWPRRGQVRDEPLPYTRRDVLPSHRLRGSAQRDELTTDLLPDITKYYFRICMCLSLEDLPEDSP